VRRDQRVVDLGAGEDARVEIANRHNGEYGGGNEVMPHLIGCLFAQSHL
jgi:hypothetical protein